MSQRGTPLSLPGITGVGWVLPGPTLASLQLGINTTGSLATTLTIPSIGALSGQKLVFQSVAADPVTGLGWTSAADAFLQ